MTFAVFAVLLISLIVAVSALYVYVSTCSQSEFSDEDLGKMHRFKEWSGFLSLVFGSISLGIITWHLRVGVGNEDSPFPSLTNFDQLQDWIRTQIWRLIGCFVVINLYAGCIVFMWWSHKRRRKEFEEKQFAQRLEDVHEE